MIKNSVTFSLRQALKEKELGNAAYKKKDFETALTHYHKAIELDPSDMTFLLNEAGEEKRERERG